MALPISAAPVAATDVLSGAARWACILGDVRQSLRALPDESVQCVVTSPPYWGLRDYGTASWEGGDPACDHSVDGQVQDSMYPGAITTGQRPGVDASRCRRCGAVRVDAQIGLESTPAAYVETMRALFAEIRRVLRDDGVLWLNLGDSYAAQGGAHGGRSDNQRGVGAKRVHMDGAGDKSARHAPSGLKPKDLVGIPWRVAFALQDDGWWLRSDIVWCLSGGAVVYARTQKGDAPTTVKDLVRLNPATVQLWNGAKWTRVLGWGESNDTSERLEIVLRSGERVGCTGGHKWPTQRGNVAARDLRVGDVIATCRLPESGNEAPGYMTTDAAWLVGLYLAEGSRADDTVQLTLHADELPWLARIGAVARHLGGSMTHTVDGNNLAVRLYGRVLAAMMESFVGGAVAHDKHLTNAVWRLPDELLREVARGYLDGDGHADSENDRVRLGFARNYALERDLRTMAARLGATLTLRPSVSRIGDRAYPSFRGEWRWDRSGHHNEKDRGEKDRGEVTEIRASKARKFWDIAVEDEPHLFALASGVLTHNCKPNPMPESVTDRPTRAHEYVFMLTKSARYFYDAEAVRESFADSRQGRDGGRAGRERNVGGRADGFTTPAGIDPSHNGGRNARSVWTITPEPYAGAHFATMPAELARRCILAGSRKGDVVLDPFGGSGTTALVAVGHGRRAILCELNAEYAALQRARLAQVGSDVTEPVRVERADFGPLFGGSL